MRPIGIRDDLLAQLESVYRLRYPDFLRTAAAITGGVEGGRDAVHDAFVSLVRGQKGYRGRGTVEAWCWRAVVNAARKQRRQAREIPIGDTPFVAPTSTDDQAVLGVAAVRVALAQLSERQRLVVYLRYYADLDYATIADVIGTRPGTIGATLHAAQETLRRSLQEESRS
jgi:RNA polymerase sigma factor (sigma-70 family)